MSVRDLFNKDVPSKILSSENLEGVGRTVESYGNVQQSLKNKNRFIPQIDFTNPANFAFYGSAEQYYNDTIKHIYDSYPYDGSLKERAEFLNKSTYLDLYILENRYPRRHGYGTIASAGAFWPPAPDELFVTPTQVEYIEFRGGPHAAPDEFQNETIQKQFPESNIYSPPDNRGSNLSMDGTRGTTIEFWFKHGPQYPPYAPSFGGQSGEILFSAVSGRPHPLSHSLCNKGEH